MDEACFVEESNVLRNVPAFVFFFCMLYLICPDPLLALNKGFGRIKSRNSKVAEVESSLRAFGRLSRLLAILFEIPSSDSFE